MSILKVASSLSIIFILITEAVRYQFYAEDENSNCPDKPETNGLHDLYDLSQMKYSYNDEGHMTIEGNLTCKWEGVKATDRIVMHVEYYKFDRGDWQLTPLTLLQLDYCSQYLDKKTATYRGWTRHIAEDERKCLNNYGHVYHLQPFEANVEFDLLVNIGGRYKFVLQMMAFDEQNNQRPNIICFQIFGELEKIK